MCETKAANRDYLCFTAEVDNAIVALKKLGNPNSVSLKYSIDSIIWQDYTPGTTGNITLRIYSHIGDKIWFRATSTNSGFSKDLNNYYYFALSQVAASGDVMSLLDATGQQNTVPNNAFTSLFKNCERLTTAPDISATLLAENYYRCMFSGCSALNSAPDIPATQLYRNIYENEAKKEDATSITDCTDSSADKDNGFNAIGQCVAGNAKGFSIKNGKVIFVK
ncbi:MAG: hypothetical protein E7070_10065 [Bacteroidales bacterium]|nr:hypothetical protein [Bacteroidales bacterium]